MDPKQCLIDADQAYSEERYADCYEHLRDYLVWRNRGGFEPPDGPDVGGPGDKFARYIACRLTGGTQYLATQVANFEEILIRQLRKETR